MAIRRIHRYPDPDDLADGVARRLVRDLAGIQEAGAVAQLCLTGGRIAQRMYARFAAHAKGALHSDQLELWWGDERFLPSSDPDRNAGPTLEILGSLGLSPALTHSMPGSDGILDGAQAASTYAKELGDTAFDICLLGMGPDGHVASIFPDHPSSDPPIAKVIEVTEAPKPPAERISLTVPVLNNSREVWFLVTGHDKADAVARAVAGDETLPGGRISGTVATRFFLDVAACEGLPVPYHCEL
ncbi:6-phosphogluconolactonase [Propionicicella superfundia]|uniref:6-phosphogluconolactonase n=1 Tax=Propionicicella superfundia TaxID=348582 RepID=UPI0004023194|nr:6-phosphogluconolactonase [Propionicicella superfundia]